MLGKTGGWEAFRNSADIAEQIMMRESYDEYEDLLRALYEEFMPHGVTEENQVLRLAKMLWSRNRIDRYMQIKMQDQHNKLEATNKLSHIEEKLKLLAPKFLKAENVKEVEELLGGLADPIYKSVIVARWPLEKCKEANTWGIVIAEGLSSLQPAKRFEGKEEFLRMVELLPIEEDFSTIERMDAAIDRTLKRLMQLKTMKQMFRQLEPKLIATSHGKSGKGVLV